MERKRLTWAAKLPVQSGKSGVVIIGQSIYCPIDSHAKVSFMKNANLSNEGSLPAAYRRLRARLNRVAWLALGSVLERDLPGQGGPRYQWSRRVKGKTVTVALSLEQFVWLKRAITNQRKVEALLAQMHRMSLE